MNLEKISNLEIKDAITRSGYLIEQQALSIFAENGYLAAQNFKYVDPITTKTREIDIWADSTDWQESEIKKGLEWSIGCECENNPQPLVFFPFEPYYPRFSSELIKLVGIPMKIWQDGKYSSFQSLMPLHKFHHYCRGMISTQYCSFIKTKADKKWIATHVEEQHDTFTSLVYCMEDRINNFYSGWEPPTIDEEEPIYLSFYYPLLVLGGELKEAILGKKGIVLKKANHVRFVNSLFLSKEAVDYEIDIITLDYLPKYLSIVFNDMKKMHNLLKYHKKVLSKSIEQIVGDIRLKDKKDMANLVNFKEFLTVLP